MTAAECGVAAVVTLLVNELGSPVGFVAALTDVVRLGSGSDRCVDTTGAEPGHRLWGGDEPWLLTANTTGADCFPPPAPCAGRTGPAATSNYRFEPVLDAAAIWQVKHASPG